MIGKAEVKKNWRAIQLRLLLPPLPLLRWRRGGLLQNAVNGASRGGGNPKNLVDSPLNKGSISRLRLGPPMADTKDDSFLTHLIQ